MSTRVPEIGTRLLVAYDECVALPESARAARIETLADGDVEFRARLERMLAFATAAVGDEQLGVEGAISDLISADPRPEAGVDRSGTSIGPFQLVRLLGCGGMGEVWLATRESDGFHQTVALKLLHVAGPRLELQRRFERERQILAELDHPGIARFIDGGVTAVGESWYAMEYVDGKPISEYVGPAGMGVRQCVELLAQVADIVAYAQSRLVVHRDLKPSNILIDTSGRPRLLDFGIAKLLGAELESSMTQTGLRAFSPAYAAPEQILGERISTATDVYSLGVVLYELLTGARPHARDLSTLDRLAESVRTEVTERPSLMARRGAATTGSVPKAVAGKINGDLDTIVLKALQRDPARRYVGADGFAEDLRRWLAGAPIAAKPDTATYRIRKFIGRHRLGVASAAMVLLALVIGSAVALWQARIARSEAAMARQAEQETELVNRFFGRMLAAARAQDQQDGAALTVVDWIRAALPQIDTELAGAPGARAQIRLELGNALDSLGESEAAGAVLTMAVAESREHFGDSLGTASALASLGRNRFALGRIDEATEVLAEANAVLDRLPVEDAVRQQRLVIATTALRLASLRGDDAAALVIAERNIEERAALYGADSHRLAVDYNNLSATQSRLGLFDAAEASQIKSAELLERDPARPIARIAFVKANLCSLAGNRAAFDEALALCTEARALLAENGLGDQIDMDEAAVTEARVRFNAGDEDGARRLLAESLPRLETAKRAVSLRDGRVTAARISIRDRNWARLAELAAQVEASLPQTGASQELLMHRALGALARYQQSRDPAALRSVVAAAQDLLSRDQSAPSYAATGALALALALSTEGRVDAAAAAAMRGKGELARRMSAADAEAVWQRWQPRVDTEGSAPDSP